MKIEHTSVQASQGDLAAKQARDTGAARELARAGQAAYREAADGGTAGPTDAVSLSSLSRQVLTEESSSPEREARVQELSALVSSGNYQVDPVELSRSIITDAERPGL
ncbi:MAG: flagellar biosynthesis anti-sigma factor FlgM [Bryobacteraceae bacterium]